MKCLNLIILSSTIEVTQLLTFGIKILIGLLAGLIALYQVKSNIIASARIKWIENLRLTLSEYSMEVINTCKLKIQLNEKEEEDFNEKELEIFKIYNETFLQAEKLGIKVILFLSPDKEVSNQKIIEEKIKGILENLNYSKSKTTNEKQIRDDIEDLIKESKKLFKFQWKKSKKIFRR